MTPVFFYLMIAVGLIGAELLIMQFSVFWFMFFGLGALVAAFAGWMSPDLSFTMLSVIFLVASLLISAVLYPFLKRWQDKPSPIAGNDAIGQSAVVTEAILSGQTGKVSWSGTDWPAQLSDGSEQLDVGATATIRKLEGIRLIVD